MSITQVEHISAIAAVVTASTGTNSPSGDHAHTVAAAVITTMRSRKTATTMVPPTCTASGATSASGAAAAKSASKAKSPRHPANPLNVVVVNTDYKKSLWGTCKAHCGPTRKVVNDCEEINPPSLQSLQ